MHRSPRSFFPFLWLTIVLAGCSGGGVEETPSGAGGSGAGGAGGGSSSTGGAGGAGGQGGAGGATCGPCGDNASCDASGVCVCDKGFVDDDGDCLDLDECTEQLDDCHPTAACMNTVGSFTCACPPGTVGDPKTGCEERFVEVTAAAYHTCARRMDNSIFCFGAGGGGRLGNGLGANQSAPVQAGAANNWLRVVAGSAHTCGIKKNGTLWCWGTNNFGQLGLGYTDNQTLPAWLSLDRTFSSVAAGDNHSCAVESDGGLFCFGRNQAGQLGIGNVDNKLELSPVSVDPLAATPDKDWKEVFAGRDTTCATKQDGRLYCWGQNNELQVSKVGGGSVTAPFLVETAPMAADADWATASIGFTTCAVKKDGRLYCWGRGNEGQLGTPLGPATAAPVAIGAGKTWKRVRANAYHICALDDQSALHCWGRNQAAQISGDAPGWVTAPTDVAPGTKWLDFAVGVVHSGGVTSDGRVLTWGSRIFGQLGDGAMSMWPAIANIGAETTYTNVVAYGETGCALNEAGELRCWGNNESGQLGLGDNKTRSAPAKVDFEAAAKVALGRQHTCMITATGKLACSGRNVQGQLGRGTNTPATTFAEILKTGKPYESLEWKEVAAGEEHNCAIATNGTLWCWGRTNEGQIGLKNPALGNLIQLELVAGQAPPTDWVSVAAGQFHTCATRATGTLWCWGRNVEGQIGNGAPAAGKTAPSSLGDDWKGPVAAGVNHTCAIKKDGTLWCWGRNANNQIGDNTNVDRPSPVQIGSATDWSFVVAANASTCAGKVGGGLQCWGANNVGQLGLGDTGQRKVPTALSGAFVAATLGFSHGCGVTQAGNLACWGSGEIGQNARGDGLAFAPVPIAASY